MIFTNPLIKRIMTAIVLIPLTLAGLFYLTPLWFCLFTSLIMLGAAWEWSRLMTLKSVWGRILYLIISAVFFYWVFTIPVTYVSWMLIGVFVWWLSTIGMIAIYPARSEWWSKGVFVRGIMGLLVMTPSLAAINILRNQTDGVYAILFLFILIWGADSAAYFAGRKWGRDKLAPLVSPGKTLQGCYGAFIFSVFITLITLWFCQVPFMVWPWAIILSLVTVMFSIVGDLFESMIKRKAAVKDSGNIFPGHGGLLDRIDSLTAAAPVFVLGGLLLGKYLS